MKVPFPPSRLHGEPQLLPLINVVFLLLIFFMLAGALSAPDPTRAQPPSSDSEQMQDRSRGVLAMSETASLALDGVSLSDEQLDAAVQAWRLSNPGLAMTLKADARVASARVVELMERLRGLGFERLRLITVPAGE